MVTTTRRAASHEEAAPISSHGTQSAVPWSSAHVQHIAPRRFRAQDPSPKSTAEQSSCTLPLPPVCRSRPEEVQLAPAPRQKEGCSHSDYSSVDIASVLFAPTHFLTTLTLWY